MALRLRRKRNVNTKTVIKLLLAVIIGLYVGGQILENFGTALLGTSSPFYTGFSLIGWTVGTGHVNASTTDCNAATHPGVANSVTDCLTATDSGGVLTVLGIVALAYVVTRVVDIRF